MSWAKLKHYRYKNKGGYFTDNAHVTTSVANTAYLWGTAATTYGTQYGNVKFRSMYNENYACLYGTADADRDYAAVFLIPSTVGDGSKHNVILYLGGDSCTFSDFDLYNDEIYSIHVGGVGGTTGYLFVYDRWNNLLYSGSESITYTDIPTSDLYIGALNNNGTPGYYFEGEIFDVYWRLAAGTRKRYRFIEGAVSTTVYEDVAGSNGTLVNSHADFWTSENDLSDYVSTNGFTIGSATDYYGAIEYPQLNVTLTDDLNSTAIGLDYGIRKHDSIIVEKNDNDEWILFVDEIVDNGDGSIEIRCLDVMYELYGSNCGRVLSFSENNTSFDKCFWWTNWSPILSTNVDDHQIYLTNPEYISVIAIFELFYYFLELENLCSIDLSNIAELGGTGTDVNTGYIGGNGAGSTTNIKYKHLVIVDLMAKNIGRADSTSPDYMTIPCHMLLQHIQRATRLCYYQKDGTLIFDVIGYDTQTISDDDLHTYPSSRPVDRTFYKHTVTAYALTNTPDASNGDYGAAFSSADTYKSSTEEPGVVQYNVKNLTFPKHFWLSYRLSAATAPRPMTYDAGTEEWYDQLDDLLDTELSKRFTEYKKKAWLINQTNEHYKEFIDDFKNRTTSVRYGI